MSTWTGFVEIVESNSHPLVGTLNCPICRYNQRKKLCTNNCGKVTTYGDKCITCFNKTRPPLGCRGTGIRTNKKGYVLEFVPGIRRGKWVFQHRLVMARHLGRELLPKEKCPPQERKEGRQQNPEPGIVE